MKRLAIITLLWALFALHAAAAPTLYGKSLEIDSNGDGTAATLSETDITSAKSAVPPTRMVAGHVLSADVTISKSDVGLSNVANAAQVTAVSGTSPIVSSGGTTPAISIPTATDSVSGALSASDHAIFTAKQTALSSTTNISVGTLGANGTILISGGIERMTNGTFDTATTGWYPSQSTLSVSSAHLRVLKDTSGTSGFGYQIVTGLTIGKRYKATYTMIGVDGGDRTAGFRVGDGSAWWALTYANGSASGTGSIYFNATTTSANIVLLTTSLTSASGYSDWDNISLTECADIVQPSDAMFTGGAAYFAGNVSVLSLTDRTKGWDGTTTGALSAIYGIRTINGSIDHDSLPVLARKDIVTIAWDSDQKTTHAITIPGRDVCMLVSILTDSVKNLKDRISDARDRVSGLKQRVNILESANADKEVKIQALESARVNLNQRVRAIETKLNM